MYIKQRINFISPSNGETVACSMISDNLGTEIAEFYLHHYAFTTQMLQAMVDIKNNLYDGSSDTPKTLGVFPADFLPKLPDYEDIEKNWIMNTDTSEKVGMHWVTILLRRTLKKKSCCVISPCHESKYYIIDSWGAHNSSIYQDIITSIKANYNSKSDHHIKSITFCS